MQYVSVFARKEYQYIGQYLLWINLLNSQYLLEWQIISV